MTNSGIMTLSRMALARMKLGRNILSSKKAEQDLEEYH
jgi:hypothetical protein